MADITVSVANVSADEREQLNKFLGDSQFVAKPTSLDDLVRTPPLNDAYLQSVAEGVTPQQFCDLMVHQLQSEYARLNNIAQPLSVAAKLTAETFSVLVLPASRGGHAQYDTKGGNSDTDADLTLSQKQARIVSRHIRFNDDGVDVLPADTAMKPVEPPQPQQEYSTGNLLLDHICANLGKPA